MKTTPFEHQQECFDVMKDQPYYGLFAEPGLGKTKIVLDIIAYNIDKKGSFPSLIVCPNTLVENWVDEVKKHSHLSCIGLTGTRARRLKRLVEQHDIYIINYESTRLLYLQLMARGFKYLVLDESTAVKNHASAQSKACYEIACYVPRKIIMSGTPIMNSPIDLFAQYKILNPLIFGISYYRFRATHCIMGGFLDKQVIRWINMASLKRKIYACAIRKTKAECLDLPDKLYTRITVDMTKEQEKLYKELKASFMTEYNESIITAPIMLTRLMRFSQITSGFTKDIEGVEHEFKKNPKIAWVVDFINNLADDKKVVIFCRFKAELAMVEKAMRRYGIGYVSVHGGTTDRIGAVKAFNTDNAIKVFIGQIQVAGIGINLTAGSYGIMLSNSYSYGDRVQIEDRLHRIGQENNVTYIDIVCRGTIDVNILNTLKNKKSLATMVVDDLKAMI